MLGGGCDRVPEFELRTTCHPLGADIGKVQVWHHAPRTGAMSVDSGRYPTIHALIHRKRREGSDNPQCQELTCRPKEYFEPAPQFW